MVNGIKCGGEIQKGKGSDRPFGHIEKDIVSESGNSAKKGYV